MIYSQYYFLFFQNRSQVPILFLKRTSKMEHLLKRTSPNLELFKEILKEINSSEKHWLPKMNGFRLDSQEIRKSKISFFYEVDKINKQKEALDRDP